MQILHQSLSPPHHPSLRLALALLQGQLQVSFLSRPSRYPGCTLGKVEKPCQRNHEAVFCSDSKSFYSHRVWKTGVQLAPSPSSYASSRYRDNSEGASPGHLGQHTCTPGQLSGLGLANMAPYCLWNVCFFSDRHLPHQIRSCPAPGASPNANAKNLPVSP